MYTNDQCGLTRLPSGWSQFYDIRHVKGKSMTKDPNKGQVKGLCYKIDFVKPLIDSQKVSACFYISIKAWNYNIYNQWHEYPVLSFLIQDRINREENFTKYISDVKIMAHEFPVKIALVHRLLTATSFFIKRIDNGIVPDVEQILMLHKVHPSQRKFYKDQSSEDLALLQNLRQIKESKEKDIVYFSLP